ncbi:MAG TPA: hypothetical protein VN709_07575 [Terriglobales bacterium]|nr:hypothetical protein [Terriglobales bacterium]
MKSRCLLAALTLLLLSVSAAAQVNVPRWSASKICPSWGCGPVHFGMGSVAVNAAVSAPYMGPTTNLHLEFPIYNRNTGTAAQVEAVLVYDSSFWGAPNNTWQAEPGAGWWLRTSQGRLTETIQNQYGACGWTSGDGTDDGTGSIYNYSFILQEPDGSQVNVGTVMEADPPHGSHPFDYYWDCPTGDSLPESFGTGDGKGYSVIASGTYRSVTGTAFDGAGDEIDNGFIDRNGNAVTTSGGSISDPLGAALSVSGSGTPSSPIVYSYTGPNNTQQQITVLYQSAYATANFGCYNNWSGNLNVPQTIIYPDGTTYNLNYGTDGRVSSLTQPGGGMVHYSYYLGVQCSPFTISDGLNQTDSLDGSLNWNWTHDTSSNQTVETDPYYNKTVTTLDSSGNPADVDAYNGSTLVQRTVISGTVSNRTAVDELCVSTTDPCGASDTAMLKSSHALTSDGFGFVTSTSDTDWGVNAPGAVLRQTVNTYQYTGNGEVLASAKTEDGSGNQSALTTLGSLDVHGNPQTESDYFSNTGSLTTNLTYNSNGTVATVTQPNGEVSTFGYQCGNGLLPSSNTVHDGGGTLLGTTSAVWDCTGGVVTSATDMNGLVASTSYDARWRPATTTAPDGAVTNISYPASSNSFSQSETWSNFSGATTDVLTTLDSLGRAVLAQQRTGPGSSTFDSVQTLYDGMGRAYSVSMPYTGSAGLGAPGGTAVTATTYDGLSHPTKVVDGGGGEVDYAYTLNGVLSTVVGASGAPSTGKYETMDGLGRLASVCEGTSGGSITGGPNFSLPGYKTTYTRNSLGAITGVVQQASVSSQETRSFSFDQLGRLTQEVNPETGTTNYSFDTDGTCGTSNGDLVKRQDNGSNVTCYGYDGFHHVTQISYPSFPHAVATPNKYFVYGTANSPVVIGGITMQHVVNRLGEAYTGAHITDEGFSYPNQGDEADAYQLSPNSGGWYESIVTSYPNGAPASLGLPAVPSIVYGIDGEGRPTIVGAGSYQNLVSSATYSALGLTNLTFASGDSDAYGFDGTTGRMTSYQFNVGGQTDIGTLG